MKRNYARLSLFVVRYISYIMFLFPQSVCKSINRSTFLKKYMCDFIVKETIVFYQRSIQRPL